MAIQSQEFRIETGGAVLRPRGILYGAGEAMCRSVPGRRVLESSYICASIGVVVSGCFEYRSQTGTFTATPGTVLLGNACEDFDYRHDSDRVIRSVIALGHGLLTEVAEACGRDPAFSVAGIMPSRRAARLYGAVRKLAAVNSPLEETIADVIAEALTIGRRERTSFESPAQRHRVLDVARYLDRAFAEPITLEQMAERARLSRFHFIRAFRSVIGENPRQYLIAARLRATANRLLDTREPIATVAFKAGFKDLSHFNAIFRSAFGVAPRAWRK
jgi:AraC-like DNA-binding protein